MTTPMSRVLLIATSTIDAGRLFPVAWLAHPSRCATPSQVRDVAGYEASWDRLCRMLLAVRLIDAYTVRDDSHVPGEPHPGHRVEWAEWWDLCRAALPRTFVPADAPDRPRVFDPSLPVPPDQS